MLIKQQSLSSHLSRQELPAVFILIGQDHFLLSQSAQQIKQIWKDRNHDTEETIIHITQASDWSLLVEKANSYSLFASNLFIDVRYEKQNLDSDAKQFLAEYSKKPNSSCLILLRAPNLTAKSLGNFTNHECIHVVQIFSLDSLAMQNWIKERLHQYGISYAPQVPSLIQQHTQGNMLACAQALEKIRLVADGTMLSEEAAKAQLFDQCEYQLFELSEACLMANADKVIQHLRHARESGTEPTLVLWLLTQEIRNLIQLMELFEKAVPLASACAQLKIWSTRVKLYQTAIKRMQKKLLFQLLRFCKRIDESIKSSQHSQIWPSLEKVALSLCLAKKVGTFA
ncbi:DNA polymerase III subunit delta [Legionella jordanis]|uniref:DNA polymerase III subunit delta n=1 Tax=Legionella jordanis TaxID=456 RepID=A0A0W0V7L6_9GAMM|nr:DNA polymerase III subunit delta [Legionella jordanis]KTD16124.1 DNA polymerase III, delta subunit [Legionella jordanis]VEH12416.1 DNA polymerase III, delta subunit [Legionella jordanis]